MAFSRLEFVKRFGLAVGGLALGGPKVLAEFSSPPREFVGRIEEIWRDGDSLVASGGLCAPIAPYYDLRVVDAFPEFRERAPLFFDRAAG